ncbi:MAG: acyltransferase family protein [Bacilli bacterium]|nr:acyltransferase family protein [Bacilli bacterium]
MKNKREYSFDILRVLAMIMVITIHVSNVYSRSFGIISNKSFIISLIFNTISRISVPIFLMISGALLLDREFNLNKYLKRLLKFIILIIVWDVIYLIWEYYYLGITYNDFYKLLFTPYRAHLWFLYTILLLYTIQPLLRKILLKSNNIIKIILLLIWILFSTGSMISPFLAQYFTFISYTGFFILGKYLYQYIKSKDLKKYNILLILIMIICFTTSIILNYLSSIKYNMFYNLYFAYRTPFIITSSFAFYTLIINNYNKDTLNKYIIKLSDLSLGVYLIHGIFLDITTKLFIYPNINSLIGIPIFTIIIFICSITCIYILKKIKYINQII